MKRWMAWILSVVLIMAAGTDALAGGAPVSDFMHKNVNGYTVWRGCVKESGEDSVTFSYTSSIDREGTQTKENKEEITTKKTQWDEDFKEGDEVRLYLSADRQTVYYACPQQSGGTLEEKLEFLKVFDVFRGYEDGAYHLDERMTRAEFAVLLMRAYYQGESAKEDALPFTDIAGVDWAKEAIGVLYEQGIIHGISDTQFDPDGTVTYGQMAAMAIRSVGLERFAQGEGGYPDGYMAVAQKAKIIPEGKKAENIALRGDMAEVLYATFDHTPTPVTNPMAPAKPVIYLYPEEKQEVNVKLELDGAFTFTYPEYRDGWHVTAKPDGTILSDGREYSYLFWEGIMLNMQEDFSKGFVVKREDTVAFLQETLERMGLTPREYNEFIVYWAPRLEKNAYNKIYFAGEDYEQAAKLTVTPEPDSILRIYMVYEPAQEGDSLPPQEIHPFQREGFTVVEWGGRELGV
jgi:hypothetical protein